MSDDPADGWGEPVPADEVMDNLAGNLQSMDDVKALEIFEHLLVNSPASEDEEGAHSISYLTLSKKFLEIHRESKQIESTYEQYYEQIDAEDMPPQAHPKRMEAMTVKKAKKKDLAEDLVLFYSLAQEVIVELSTRLTEDRIQGSDPFDFVSERTSSKFAPEIKSTIQNNDDAEKIADELLSQPQREKYLYYTDKIGKDVHDDLVHIRSNLRNQLIHNVRERQTLDSFNDTERDMVKCVGAINQLSLLADDEVAIEVTDADDGDHIVTENQ
jgi:hypothetical protein